MRTVQETFQAVIENDHYGVEADRSEYMCWALFFALMSDDITLDEFCAAKRAIDDYLGELRAGPFVVYALRDNGIETHGLGVRQWAQKHGREFYLDWDNRPRREV